ncbi:MAG: leucine-rich repeat protein [Dysgonamonadaceae bacterium]|nr:leucine-rich repeat protein [Dysgonamonadaceae bacterium]
MKSISFETNKSWTAKSDASWCTLTPTSGGASTKSITVTVVANETYDDRSCNLTITVGGLSKTIAVTQSQQNAVLISEKIHDLSSEEQALEVELQTNVEIEVVIATKAQSWVQHTETRAMSTKTVMLNIAENESWEDRSTEVYIKNRATNLQETLTINQTGKDPWFYYVETMGTLGEMLNQTQKDTITTMIVRGEINKADFDVMKSHIPNLRYIDLKDVVCEDDSIPESAFGDYDKEKANKNISTIILPDGLITIGDYAFYRCSGLSGSLILPTGVTEIGKRAFRDCSNLTGDLIFSDNVISIGEAAFRNCSGFTSLKLGENVTSIGIGAFSGCSGFTGNLAIPDKLTTIEESVFKNCSGFIGDLIIPNNIISIGDEAFAYCTGFVGGLTIANSVREIIDGAFYGCSGFTGNLILPNLLSIKSSVFADCSGFTGELIIPDGVTYIEESAFRNCSGFTSLKLGNSLSGIRGAAFANCVNISGKIVFPITLGSIYHIAFEGCNKVDAFRFPHTSTIQYFPEMLPSGATVEVPNEAVSNYKSTNGWKNHTIVGY